MSVSEFLEPAAAILVTMVGLFFELTASQWLMNGEFVVGLWLVYMGAIALYAGLFVVGGGLLPSPPEPAAE